ncbi:hypothetical protein BDR22DRAFT_825531 [Usnea florida]
MISSRKTLKSRSLHGSAKPTIILNHSRTSHGPPISVFAFSRDFSWDSKHRNNTKCAVKVYKGFLSGLSAGKDMIRKQCYQSTLWGGQHLRRHYPRYAPIQEWRFSSSWGKKPIVSPRSRNEAKMSEAEDWYARWEKQKLKQYEDFMKRVEHDPYTALFGTSWMNLSGENTGTQAAQKTSVPKTETTPKTSSSNSKPSGSRSSEASNTREGQPKSEATSSKERDPYYEIDPITNRKVLKTSASPVSTATYTDPHVEDTGKAFEMSFKRWGLVSPSPLDRRFVMIEHAQASSSPHPSSNGNPHPKPQKGNGWLAQEGFGKPQEPKAGSQSALPNHEAKPHTTATKIETALDRHLSSKSTNEEARDRRTQLFYKSEENKNDDVDLLRPSDVRASAGLRGNQPKETKADKLVRRRNLEKSFASRSLDHTSHTAGEIASKTLVKQTENSPAKIETAPELDNRSQSTEKRQDGKPRDEEGSKDTTVASVNEVSDAKDYDPVSVDQTPASMLVSKEELVSEPLNAVARQAQCEARDKASKLKAQIVPFKAKLDAMKADYDSLRQQWLREVRKAKEKAAKEEEDLKAQKLAKKAREIHEDEIKTQKLAMEAMETRRSDGSSNKTTLDQGIGNDAGRKQAPRRLQSFLQGEGDMASNVHEFAARDRWYKRKAPHATDANDAEMNAKLQKLAADRALIREVRGIYEDTYGTIDTKHRQPEGLPISLAKESTSSSGSVSPKAQLPSNTAGVTDSSRRLDGSQRSDPLEIIQKLFGQLRDAQSIVQEYRGQTKQALGLSDHDINKSKAPGAFENIAIQIVRTSGQLAGVSLGSMVNEGFGEAVASKKPTINNQRSLTAPTPNDPEAEKAIEPNEYCLLVYNPPTGTIQHGKITASLPLPGDESFLPLDAIKRLSNPGMFLPHIISLGSKGYKPVSIIKDMLILKKEITPPNLAETKGTDESDDFAANRALGSVADLKALGRRYAQLQETKTEQRKAKEIQKQASKTDMAHQKVEEARKTSRDGIEKEKQPSQEAQHQPSKKVRRQETVFSGSRLGKWVDSSSKSKKSKRSGGKRPKTLKHMIMAGAFTAGCCYAVGVKSWSKRQRSQDRAVEAWTDGQACLDNVVIGA